MFNCWYQGLGLLANPFVTRDIGESGQQKLFLLATETICILATKMSNWASPPYLNDYQVLHLPAVDESKLELLRSNRVGEHDFMGCFL